MQLGKNGATLTAERFEYVVLQANHAPAPLAVLVDERFEEEVITGAEYDIEEMNLLANAAVRAQERAMTELYPYTEDMQSTDLNVRKTAMEKQRRAVFDDDGTRGKQMRTVIVASKILSDLEQISL